MPTEGMFPPVLRNSGGKPGESDTATSSAGKTGALCIGETTKSQIYTEPVLPLASHIKHVQLFVCATNPIPQPLSDLLKAQCLFYLE